MNLSSASVLVSQTQQKQEVEEKEYWGISEFKDCKQFRVYFHRVSVTL